MLFPYYLGKKVRFIHYITSHLFFLPKEKDNKPGNVRPLTIYNLEPLICECVALNRYPLIR